MSPTILTILYWVVIVTMLLGVVGAVVPAVPGPSLILGALLVWCLATGFHGFGWPMVLVALVLILSVSVELLAAYWGAKQVGASNWSQVGAVVGMIVGFLGLLPALPFGGPLVGILIGPFLGALLGEFIYRRELGLKPRFIQALKASMAVVIGSLIGNILEGILALAAVIIFVVSTWPPVPL
ncbi:hypothetical protein BST81_04590 [Leptolyngbya sp. 'hensonii']|uniref:DUF456 domain-containing protein n=1 Tax=Leptolyngbya sp. 'hensonii' TaxID=1922337 RepID=UPI00094FD5E0|nr:DUF456 domain-containing protein [Leptolyngbya sp. 'hensonii']OLP19553.1 hypothetical protein BST81_04590 [Leptolyngbya sp. 'hensonii']